MPLDLDDDEKAALIELLTDTIAADRFPLSPRVKRWQAILDKLDPPAPKPAPYPPLESAGCAEHGAPTDPSALGDDAPAPDEGVVLSHTIIKPSISSSVIWCSTMCRITAASSQR
jgi:hypothetical protein